MPQVASSSPKAGERPSPVTVTTNFSSLVSSQIRYLVTNLNKKNAKTSTGELHQLVELYGSEAYLFLLRSLVTSIDFKDVKGQKDQLRVQLLAQEVAQLAKQPNFSSIVCQALEGLETVQDDFVSQFCKLLKLPLQQEILIALSLAQSAEPAVHEGGEKHLRLRLPELTNNMIKSLPENLLHNLLYYLRNSEGFAKQAQVISKPLQKLNPIPSSLIPLLYDSDSVVLNSKVSYTREKNPKQDALFTEPGQAVHISALMQDLGYGCCETHQAFKDLLSQFPDLKESDVALMVAMMARTHSSLEAGGPLIKDFPPRDGVPSAPAEGAGPRTWSLPTFVDCMKELYPKLSWPLVIRGLDHPGFALPDPKALALIMAVYRRATKEPFPLDFLFENWTNTAGQLSFLKLAVGAPPDLFNFALGSGPRVDAEGLTSVSKTVGAVYQSWYSVTLVETLLRLAQEENYGLVRQIFNYPIKHCPELLLLGMAQAKTTNQPMVAELSSILVPPVLLSNNPSSSFVIHRLWTLNPNLLVRSMVELYEKDPASLSRLLEIATQDLKALTPILDARPFSFVIDLAMLASRREFLNLGKWLQGKLAEHGNAFAKACIASIKEKASKTPRDQPNQRMWDTLTITYSILASHTSALSPEVLEELKQLGPKFPVAHDMLPQAALAQPGSAAEGAPAPVAAAVAAPSPAGVAPSPANGPGDPPSRVFPTEVEDTANSYFQRIYTSQMSIDDVISMLKRFKSSKEQFEQDVFACMIHNLFDEYRFFPKYPDKELQITGILFGSLIQHQLVSYLPLGVALRYVLDALRKAPTNKMFKFGLIALEQFKSRLAEWPQYCSHIMGIPHVRKVHPDIIEFIEQTHSNLPAIPPAGAQAAPGATAASGPSPPGVSPTPSPAPSGASVVAPPPGFGPAVLTPAATPPPSDVAAPSPSLKHPPGLPVPVAPPAAAATPTPPPTGAAVAATSDGKAADKKAAEAGAVSHTQLPIETLLSGASAAGPPLEENEMDKIHFIFNNVSLQNLDHKVPELLAVLKEERHFLYLAQYLVVKRLSIEANFHTLYLTFLDRLKNPRIFQLLLGFTYDNIQKLLASEKIVVSAPERALLKNLGSWLGLTTVARNKPLLQKDLSLKDLLFEAYSEGRLIAVIPFVCKVLEHCANSKVFKPPNPWVMAIMKVLSEIYRKPNLRLNMKFEIEVLCKALSLDINDVKPSDFLKDRAQYFGANNFDFHPVPATHQLDGPPSTPDLPVALSADPTEDAAFIPQLGNYLQVSANIPLFVQQPALKRCIPVAVDRAIREIISPVVERSVTIACITTRELVCKDFAVEPDEVKMRKAAHLMVQNLAGSLALVTCKEPLRLSMSNHLRSLLTTHTPAELQPIIEQAVQIIANENLDLACTLIEKAATDRAIKETDETLSPNFAARKKHRDRLGGSVGVVAAGGTNPGTSYYDIQYFQGRYPANLPEPLRTKFGGLQAAQLRVYDDFARISHIQAQMQQQQAEEGATPGSPKEDVISLRRSGAFDQQPQESLTPQQSLERFEALQIELDALVLQNVALAFESLPAEHKILSLLRQIPLLVTQSFSRAEVAQAFAIKILRRLYDDELLLYQEIHFHMLERISEVHPKIVKDITAWVIAADEQRKYNRDITIGLVQAHLINLPELDAHIAKLIDPGRSRNALEFAVFLIMQCVIEQRYANPSEMKETLDAITKVVRTGGKGSEELQKIVDEARSRKEVERDRLKRVTRQIAPRGEVQHGMASLAIKDGDETREQVARMFEEWMSIYLAPNQNDKAMSTYVAPLVTQGPLKDDEQSARFFRLCTEICIEHCLGLQLQLAQQQAAGDQQQQADVATKQAAYQWVDGFSKLVVVLVKYVENPSTKVAVLTRVLGEVVRVLMRDYDEKRTAFNQRPYFRLFSNWLVDFNSPDPTLEPINLQLLISFSNAFNMLQPSRLPGFAFAWLELISHRYFMPKLLLSKTQKYPQGWPLFQRLLVELFKFLEPFLRNVERTVDQLSDSIRVLYKGTLRVLLVLLHDFPEFLCDYHFSFCDVIPSSCIQMRNLILSAFPRNMRLPDPFTPNLKVDLLPEIMQSPRILSNYTAALSAADNIKAELDTYLKMRAPVNFLLDLRSKLTVSEQEALSTGTRYNVPLLNSLVWYVGIHAINQSKNAQMSSPITHSAPMDIFQHLALDLDTEGRYLFLNAIANQLRYPNNHTHYFSCVLLYLFAEATQEIIQEQITRVLLERLIVNRPHPWGLLITFIELIKNPRYNFWSHNFTRCAPEVERLFESVARSCMSTPTVAAPRQPADEQGDMPAGGSGGPPTGQA